MYIFTFNVTMIHIIFNFIHIMRNNAVYILRFAVGRLERHELWHFQIDRRPVPKSTNAMYITNINHIYSHLMTKLSNKNEFLFLISLLDGLF